MCIQNKSPWFVVADKHGGFDHFDTLAEAEAHAKWLVQGYLDGNLSGNDPMPTITRCENVRRYSASADGLMCVAEIGHA